MRAIAVVLGALAVLTLLFSISLVSGLASVGRFPGLMVLTVASWMVTIVGGAFGAVQLWRFKRSGWIAAVAVFAVGFLYYTVGFGWFHGPRADLLGAGVSAVFYLLGLIVLGLPSCRRLIERGV